MASTPELQHTVGKTASFQRHVAAHRRKGHAQTSSRAGRSRNQIQTQGFAGRADDRREDRESEDGRARHDHRRRLGARAHSRARAGRALGDGRGQRHRGDGRKRTADRRRQRASLRRADQESRRDRTGSAAKIFRRARTDAHGIENWLAACSAAGRQIPHLLHASRPEQSVHAVFVDGNHARRFSNARSLRPGHLFFTKMSSR